MRTYCCVMFSFAILFFCGTNARILIITTAFNRPDFIELQHATFEKFLKDDYEFQVFSDANTVEMERSIQNACQKCGIKCTRVPQYLHNVDPQCHKAPASFRHGEALQFALEQAGFKHDDIVMIIDSDIFLIREFSIRQYLGEGDLLGFFDKGSYCLSANFCMMNIPKLCKPYEINFRAAHVNSNFMEAGSQTINYIQSHPDLKWKKITRIVDSIYPQSEHSLEINLKDDLDAQLKHLGYSSIESNLIKSFLAFGESYAKHSRIMLDCDVGFYEHYLFLDYKHGSSWHNPDPIIKETKDRLIKQFFNALLG